ncbi:MAG: hypothetical protein R6W90_00915 [Ignavibacteriaceae bacterium]
MAYHITFKNMKAKKMHRNFLLLILLLGILPANIIAQRSDPSLLSIGLHTGNRIGISFHNDGQIAGFLVGVDIRGEWPLGSGENYIGDCIPLIGAEFFNMLGDTLQSVIISRGPRNRQGEERHPVDGHFWGWNPLPGFRNSNYESVAMSHLPESYPIGGWNDPIARNWVDDEGNTQWFGYFGRNIKNADQESIFDADDQADDEFNFLNFDPSQPIFLPDSRDPSRLGLGLRMRVRGFQWSNFLAEDAIFWLYDITNEGTTTYRKANFGTVVGTLAGGDGDSGDDQAFFDVEDWITYSWDSDGIGNKGQKVGYVGYAFLESPGNSFDGIDNDGDSENPDSPNFVKADFDSVTFNVGDVVVLINPDTYERTTHQINSLPETVTSMGVEFVIEAGKYFREGQIGAIQPVRNGFIYIPHASALDGIDNDLDGLIDENEAVHFATRNDAGVPGLKYINYVTGNGLNDLLIDEKRDNDIDEDQDWNPLTDDVGIDGLGPRDNNYEGPDEGEGNGIPDQGEPNFGRTDPDESDQIGLTSFNFFNIELSPDMSNDTLLWSRMTPGRFDVVPAQPQDGDFIYASGYFPLIPSLGNPDIKERFSVSLLFGEDLQDIVSNKRIVQQIYNSGYKFPQPPLKPKISISQEDGNVVIYWDNEPTQNDIDFITKKRDFQGYKIYRATDQNFADSRVITNAQGFLAFDKPIAQYDLADTINGYFYPSRGLLETVGGTTFYLGDNTGITNKFVDSNVVLGQTYYYAVCAYDEGDSELDIFPTENSKFIRRANTGEIITDDNTGYITPGARPAGYVKASFTDIQKSDNFIGTGSVEVQMVDDQAVRDGYNYQVVFEDSGAQDYTANWSLLDLQTPDTLIIPGNGQPVIVNPMQTITIPSVDTIIVNGRPFGTNGSTSYTAAYDSIINKSSVFSGNTPVQHGFRLQLYNDQNIRLDTSKSGFVGEYNDPNRKPTISIQTLRDVNYPANNGLIIPNDYLIEFSNVIVDTSVADTIFPVSQRNIHPAEPVTFRIKNLTKDQYIDFAYFRTGTISTTHTIDFKENIQGNLRRTWRVVLNYVGTNIPIEQQGTYRISTLKPFNETDKLTFSMQGAKISSSATESDLDKIKVVPNPYVVTHEAEARLLSTQVSGRGEREIRFTHVPPGSKIYIYTVRGELIRTLSHDNLFVGDVYWNLRTEENLDVAYGVYVYVVETENIGKKIGKLALIK